MMLPLAARGQLLGVLALVLAESGRRYGPDDLALGQELAARAALALDNARLYQAEQATRRRLAILAEAGAALTASLDFEATLARVARLVVPALADWCTVDLVDDAEPVGLRRLAVVHADPAKEALVARLADYPPRPPAEHPVLTVVRTGQPALGVDVPADVIEAAAQDAEHLALVRAIGMRSFMIVPLRVRDRVLGAICLAAAESGRRYGPDDLALAEQLAERAALAIDNARLYSEARSAVRIREEFLAVASHELRTPLTSVKGYVQLLDRQLRDDAGPWARLRGLIDPLHTQVRRLETLVGDLLDVSRLQQGRLELRPEPVELGELARQVVARFEHSPYRTPGHTLVVDAPEPVMGEWDAARLDQVLTNLVGNALKFSPMGGEVRVAARREVGEAVLTVSDEGLGIGPDERASLFQPFQRGEATARAIPGVGLGLYITSEIVARHGGRIEIASAVGVGSTFVVRLPLSA
jgi:signal transduction histidine kinase